MNKQEVNVTATGPPVNGKGDAPTRERRQRTQNRKVQCQSTACAGFGKPLPGGGISPRPTMLMGRFLIPGLLTQTTQF